MNEPNRDIESVEAPSDEVSAEVEGAPTPPPKASQDERAQTSGEGEPQSGPDDADRAAVAADAERIDDAASDHGKSSPADARPASDGGAPTDEDDDDAAVPPGAEASPAVNEAARDEERNETTRPDGNDAASAIAEPAEDGDDAAETEPARHDSGDESAERDDSRSATGSDADASGKQGGHEVRNQEAEDTGGAASPSSSSPAAAGSAPTREGDSGWSRPAELDDLDRLLANTADGWLEEPAAPAEPAGPSDADESGMRAWLEDPAADDESASAAAEAEPANEARPAEPETRSRPTGASTPASRSDGGRRRSKRDAGRIRKRAAVRRGRKALDRGRAWTAAWLDRLPLAEILRPLDTALRRLLAPTDRAWRSFPEDLRPAVLVAAAGSGMLGLMACTLALIRLF